MRGARQLALARLHEPATTPSARVLAAMEDARQPFFRFALDRSIEHRRYFTEHPLAPDLLARFEEQSRLLLAEQRALEAADDVPFETFLETYLALPAQAP